MEGNGDSRVRALSEKAKRPLTQPLPGGHDAQSVSPQKAEAPFATDRERRRRLPAHRVGPQLVSSGAPPPVTRSHLAVHRPLPRAVHPALFKSDPSLRRTGPATPRQRDAPPCLSRRHARPWARTGRVQFETAPVVSAPHWCRARRPGRPDRCLVRRYRLWRPAA